MDTTEATDAKIALVTEAVAVDSERREVRQMNIKRNVLSFLSPLGFFGIMMMVLMGCSGGGGDSGVTGDRPALLNGVFVDSPVEGLYYETDTQSGFTDANGMFTYMEGEVISFSIGDVMFGQAPARGFMTPVNLVEGAVDETHPAVTNMAMLMQTLDVDGNPDNGITITPEIEEGMMGRQLDFNLNTASFQSHPEVVDLLDHLNELEVFSDGPHMLVPEEAARNHMRQHIDAAGNNDNTDGDGINMGGEANTPAIHDDDSPQRQPGMNTGTMPGMSPGADKGTSV